MHLSPAFLALSLALTSLVVAHPMPPRGELPEAHTFESGESYLRDGFHWHPLVRRAPKEKTDEERQRLAEYNRQYHRTRWDNDPEYRARKQEQRKKYQQQHAGDPKDPAKVEETKKRQNERHHRLQREDPAYRERHKQHSLKSYLRGEEELRSQLVASGSRPPPPPDTSPVFLSPAPVYHGTTPAHDSYDMHSGQSSGMTPPYPAMSQHPGPSQAQAQHGAYGTHNSGGPSYSGMAPPYAPPRLPQAAPQAPYHASTMQAPPIPHNPLAPVPQVPQHISPYYDTRYHAPGAAGMPNDFSVGGTSHAGGGPVVPQVPISTPEGRRQLRPGFHPPDPKDMSTENSLAAALQERPRRQ